MTLTLKEILTVTLNLMMHDVYVYAPLIYYVLFYLSLCAFYEKTKNVNLMTLMMILKLTLILTLNVCIIFNVTFSSQLLSQIFSCGLTLKLTLKSFLIFSKVTSSPFLTLKNFVTFS